MLYTCTCICCTRRFSRHCALPRARASTAGHGRGGEVHMTVFEKRAVHGATAWFMPLRGREYFLRFAFDPFPTSG